MDATVEVADVTKDQEEDVDAMKVVDADHLVDYLAETIADAEIAEFYSSDSYSYYYLQTPAAVVVDKP